MPVYNTRIQLKSDTEANWNAIDTVFRPLPGEVIIYSADNNHPYCRIKIGNAEQDPLHNLQFLDAGTINGNEVEVVKVANRSSFPATGSSDKLYIDLSTNLIYHYEVQNNVGQYFLLSNFTFTTSTASTIIGWNAGSSTTISLENNILKIVNGSAPSLNHVNTQVVTSIQKG